MDPIRLLQEWLEDYKLLGVYGPEAAILSTSSQGGVSSRVVLIRQINDEGLVFFTNSESRKAQDILHDNRVSVHFYFREQYRQVQVRGRANIASDYIADEYFSQRSREKQISAWASRQSQIMKSDQNFDLEIKEFESKFNNKKINRPSFWQGYVIDPNYFEFWTEGVARRHLRQCFEKNNKGDWRQYRLYP